MSLNDPLANVLNNITTATRAGKKECIASPVSRVIQDVLQIIKDNMYIGDFEVIKDGRGDIVKINLLGAINKCNVIKPRFSIKKDDYEKYEQRYLPAKNFGILIISTTNGIMTNHEAKKKNIGGRLLAYVY